MNHLNWGVLSSVPICSYFYIVNFVPYPCPTNGSSAGLVFIWILTNHFARHYYRARGPPSWGTSWRPFSCWTACYLHHRGRDSQTWVSLEFTGVNWSSLYSHPDVQRRISSLDLRSFVPRVCPWLYLQCLSVGFHSFPPWEYNHQTPFGNHLIPMALGFYDTRDTEWITTFCGHDPKLAHYRNAISYSLLNLWLDSPSIKVNSLWDNITQTGWSHQPLGVRSR